MMAKTEQLETGCVLQKDVYSKSVKPLMKAGTVLNETHIAFLKAFLIDQVEVDHLTQGKKKRTVAKKETAPKMDSPKSIAETSTVHPLDRLYKESVDAYAAFFANWQSGSSVMIGDFRKAMMPLITGMMNDPMWFSSFLVSQSRFETLAARSVTFGLLATFFAKKFNCSTGETVQLGLAGMLADCGLSKLTPSLLNKKEDYVGSEKALYKKHVVDSYKMLKGLPTLKNEVLIAIIQHHEREDGSGYPLAIEGSQLSQYGKILAICDTFLNQLASSRRSNVLTALGTMRDASYGKLSGYLMDKFCYELMTLFIGMNIRLSNGQSGEITFIPVKDPTRPMIHLTDNRVIALSETRNVTIECFM
ncbi:HD-GYP domain-containing protein [Sporolactobacillus kofuensis]|uniref:HD-GYP domain-containing protein n=1 Tax=Sporolactobacillus kofuensis TaxID=269672 RepID=A0ABW1WEI1_9BACL|nr:HD domain-containing phosphohydrolase [Sporolactobacillus kofuensis]MCO7175278.1 metal-dependent phosphohydrolase [Sporolactobacillus kofuensis]